MKCSIISSTLIVLAASSIASAGTVVMRKSLPARLNPRVSNDMHPRMEDYTDLLGKAPIFESLSHISPFNIMFDISVN